VLESVKGIESGTLAPTPQSDHEASHAPKLTHETCRIDFSKTAIHVHNLIRGLSPYPTAWTILDGQQLNVYRSELIDSHTSAEPGAILSDRKNLDIACGEGIVRLLEVQLPGKRRMKSGDLLNGYKISSEYVGRQA
jgi:methionyl-tRNA formyltransferase